MALSIWVLILIHGNADALGACSLTVHALFSIYLAFDFIMPAFKKLFKSALLFL